MVHHTAAALSTPDTARGAARPDSPALSCEQLGIAVTDRTLVHQLALQLARGEFLAILGRNGCGKSLTLQTLAGLRAPQSGHISLHGRNLQGLSRKHVARHIGLLLQDREDALALTAMDSVLLGRHPHLPVWQPLGAQDERIAVEALQQLGVADCAERQVSSLSGGEQRRVAMAGLLAQQPQVYLLDEPSNHLDPHHQIHVLDLFRRQCDAGASVIATLHDPTLAARYADRALLLYGDGRYRIGPSHEVLTASTLSELYLCPIVALEAPPLRAFVAG